MNESNDVNLWVRVMVPSCAISTEMQVRHRIKPMYEAASEIVAKYDEGH